MASTQPDWWTVNNEHHRVSASIRSSTDTFGLLDGQLLTMTSQSPPHAATTTWASDYLRTILRGRATIRVQLPVILAPNSTSEPDIAIVRIDPDRYVNHHPHPDDILLLIEIADATLERDRTLKALAYATAHISDYWVLDLQTRQVCIFRQPTADGYQQEMVLPATINMVAIAFPDIRITIDHLFP